MSEPSHRSADARLWETLYRVASLAPRARDPRATMQSLLESVVSYFDAAAGVIALVDPNDGSLEVEVVHGLEPTWLRHRVPKRHGLLGWTAFHARPTLLPDSAGDWRQHGFREDLRCEMCHPLEERGQVLGVLYLGHPRPSAWTAEDITDLNTLGEEGTRVLQQVWQLRQLRVKSDQLAVLIDVGQKLVTQVDQQDLLDTLAREAVRLVGCELAQLHLLSPERDRLELRSLATAAATTPGAAIQSTGVPSPTGFPLTVSLTGAAVHTRKQFEATAVLNPEYLDCPDVPRTHPVHTLLATPLLADGEVTGVLGVFSRGPHRFSNDERRLLLALANLGAVALQNARLYARALQGEEHLQRNEKLTTLGLLAAEIAHEIRNPLTVLKLLFGSLGLDYPGDDPRRRDLAIIGEKLDQLEAIVGRVLNFGRSSSALHARCDLGELLRDTLLLVRFKLQQSKVTGEYQPPPAPIWVEANRGQLQQVLLNLIINALHAMPAGGRIAIRTEPDDSGPQPRVAVEVEDTGSGIPGEVVGRIFDSFLSARPGGTGLGLAISKRIMVAHHGDIEVARTGPTGTVMRLRLPRLPEIVP